MKLIIKIITLNSKNYLVYILKHKQKIIIHLKHKRFSK